MLMTLWNGIVKHAVLNYFSRIGPNKHPFVSYPLHTTRTPYTTTAASSCSILLDSHVLILRLDIMLIYVLIRIRPRCVVGIPGAVLG